MAGRIGGPGGKDPISSAPLEETGTVGGGGGAGTGEVADHAGNPNAKRTVRAKSMDMSGIDLASQLNAKLDAVPEEGHGDSGVYGDEVALIPVPEFEALVEKVTGDGIDAKDAKALVALAEKMIKNAPDPEATMMAIGDKIHIMLNNLEMPPDATQTLADASSDLWVKMSNESLARIDSAVQKLGEHLKANAGSLKPPLSNIDPKSLARGEVADGSHLAFKLKNGKAGTLESPEGKALAKLLEKDPKLASVTVGVQQDFIGEEVVTKPKAETKPEAGGKTTATTGTGAKPGAGTLGAPK